MAKLIKTILLIIVASAAAVGVYAAAKAALPGWLHWEGDDLRIVAAVCAWWGAYHVSSFIDNFLR